MNYQQYIANKVYSYSVLMLQLCGLRKKVLQQKKQKEKETQNEIQNKIGEKKRNYANGHTHTHT